MSRLSAVRQQMGEFRSLTLDFDPFDYLSITARSRDLPMAIDSAPKEHQPGSRLFHLTLAWDDIRYMSTSLGWDAFHRTMERTFIDNRFTFEKIHVLALTTDSEMEIDVLTHLPKQKWLLYFTPLINTKTLWISHMLPYANLLDAATPIPHDTDNQSTKFLFPELSEVRITFKESLRTYAERLWEDGALLFEPLRRLATARRRGNARLVLRLEGCMVPRAILESLGDAAWVLEDGQSLPEHAEITRYASEQCLEWRAMKGLFTEQPRPFAPTVMPPLAVPRRCRSLRRSRIESLLTLKLPTNQPILSNMQRNLNAPFLSSKSSQMKQAQIQHSAAYRQRRRAAQESITSRCWQYPKLSYHALADADVALELADVDIDVQQDIWDTFAPAEEKREDEPTSFPFPCVVVPEKKAKRRGKGKGKERAVLTDGEAFEMIGDDALVVLDEGVWDEDEWEIVRGDEVRSEGRRVRPTYSAIVKGGGAHAGD
ncbi:hypothetical protein EVG20_g200 [Dentipellis fragilis]|uniref:Uncharacterized protein n=1 Tax=Dentipellis fragilis TaxID=205917 RepID=A0A4Y9ZG53_9AGAM|nr:hypothetical protein EVG20_g200 [Dentipellis fragilis]